MKFLKNVTVAVLDVPPFFKFEKDGKITGYESLLLDMLSQALGFSYNIVTPPTKDWGNRDANGSWNGLVKMVMTDEADMAMCNVGYTEDRYTAIDFSFPYSYVNLVFATNLPKPLPREKIFLYAFDLITWIVMLLLLLFLPLAFKLMTGAKASYIDHLLAVFGNLLHQPTEDEVMVGKFMMLCWWFVSLILSTSFSAGLSSIMTVPFTEPTLENFQDLAVALETDGYQVYTMRGTAMIPLMRVAKQPHFPKIASLIEKNDWFAAPEEFPKAKEFRPKTAMLGVTVMLHYWYGKPPLSTKHIAKDETITTRVGVMIGKNFCCKKRLNDAVLKILGSGLYDKLVNEEFFLSWLRASKEGLEGNNEVALSMNDVSGAFALLFCGCMVSIVTFVCEITCMRLRK